MLRSINIVELIQKNPLPAFMQALCRIVCITQDSRQYTLLFGLLIGKLTHTLMHESRTQILSKTVIIVRTCFFTFSVPPLIY